MNTQTQRALIQLVESLVISAAVSALISIDPLLTGTNANWRVIGVTFGAAFVIALAHGVVAYFKAPAQIAVATQAMPIPPPPQSSPNPIILPNDTPKAP